MKILVDSREKPHAIKDILGYFNENNVVYEYPHKLDVGDYMIDVCDSVTVDRKQNLQEFVQNITSKNEHERFRREMLRAIKNNTKLVILIEHGPELTCIEDVYFFYQPPQEHWRWTSKKIGSKTVRTREMYVQNAIDGKKIYKSMKTIHERYNVDFYFCNKNETAMMILNILEGYLYDR